jgi:HD-GYP domain-containing protein (c-di-GMP phosphodiesterase class II)
MTGSDRQTPELDVLALVQEFNEAIASSLVLEETLSLIARRVTEALDAFECDVYEYDAETGTLTSTACWSLEPSPDDGAWIGTVVDITDRPAYGRILGSKQVAEDHVDDPGIEPIERSLMEQWGEKSALSVPLVFRDRVIGCLVVLEKRSVRRFSERERKIVSSLAVPAAIAIHNANMYRHQEDRARHFAALLDAGRAITSTICLEDVLALVAENVAETLQSSVALIYEYDPVDDSISLRSYFARPGEGHPDFDPDIGRSYNLADYPSDRLMLAGGRPVVQSVSDPSLAADVRDSMERWSEKTALTVPLVFNNEPLGFMELIETRRERHFAPDEIELAQGLGEQAAIAIHNARLFRRREEQNRRLVTLLEVSQAITGTLDAAEVVSRITSEVGNLFPGVPAAAEVWLRVDDDLFVAFQDDLSRRGDAAADRLAVRPDPLAREATMTLSPTQAAADDGRRLVIPVVLDRQAEGYVDLRLERGTPFSEDEIQLVQLLVNHAAIALENADNYGRLETMYLETVTALAAAMEAKDHYTAEHADMLAAMAVTVGRELGLSENELRELQYAAVLHDIGKIGVPGHILNKPDRLTDDEFKQMAQHTIIGERIISRIEYLEPIARVIRAAHERWDGGGYPDRIAGEQIPLASRILLVCDAFHAMTSNRPYRAALPEEHALLELTENAGSQFDPKVVDVFVEALPRLETDPGEAQLKYVLPVWKDRKHRLGGGSKRPT